MGGLLEDKDNVCCERCETGWPCACLQQVVLGNQRGPLGLVCKGLAKSAFVMSSGINHFVSSSVRLLLPLLFPGLFVFRLRLAPL